MNETTGDGCLREYMAETNFLLILNDSTTEKAMIDFFVVVGNRAIAIQVNFCSIN